MLRSFWRIEAATFRGPPEFKREPPDTVLNETEAADAYACRLSQVNSSALLRLTPARAYEVEGCRLQRNSFLLAISARLFFPTLFSFPRTVIKLATHRHCGLLGFFGNLVRSLPCPESSRVFVLLLTLAFGFALSLGLACTQETRCYGQYGHQKVRSHVSSLRQSPRKVSPFRRRNCNTSTACRGARGGVLGYRAVAGKPFSNGNGGPYLRLVVSFGVMV